MCISQHLLGAIFKEIASNERHGLGRLKHATSFQYSRWRGRRIDNYAVKECIKISLCTKSDSTNAHEIIQALISGEGVLAQNIIVEKPHRHVEYQYMQVNGARTPYQRSTCWCQKFENAAQWTREKGIINAQFETLPLQICFRQHHLAGSGLVIETTRWKSSSKRSWKNQSTNSWKGAWKRSWKMSRTSA